MIEYHSHSNRNPRFTFTLRSRSRSRAGLLIKKSKGFSSKSRLARLSNSSRFLANSIWLPLRFNTFNFFRWERPSIVIILLFYSPIILNYVSSSNSSIFSIRLSSKLSKKYSNLTIQAL